MYAKIQNDQVAQYPYNTLRQDNPQASFPATPNAEVLAEFGLVVVQNTARPAYNAMTEYVAETTPVKVGESWHQAWSVLSLSAEAIAAKGQAAKDIQDATDAKAYAKLTALQGMSPAEVTTYFNNRKAPAATNLAEANVMMAKIWGDLNTLGIAVSILSRRL